MNARMQATDWTAERIARLLNKAKKSPTGWKACCPAHDDSDPSLFIADGEDGIAMVCYRGCTYRDISDALKLKGVELFPSRDRREIPKEHFQLGEYHSHWDYHDTIGQIVMRICRWEQPGGKKDIRPLVRTADGWKWQHHPAPRPLYQLDRLVNDADVPAIIVEGEKTAAAAQKLFPDHIATTWAGGASAMGQADWAPLAGREVILIPDCDNPGRKAMQWIRHHLEKICKSVRLVDPSTIDASLSDGWDLADALKDGRDVTQWLVSAKEEPAATTGIQALPFTADMLLNIPPRKWLYRRHYMRGMVSLTASPGGVGKSSVQMVEAVSMALGRDLLRDREPLKLGKLKVWLHNGEDPMVELRRRLGAICIHFRIDPKELEGYLFLTSGRDTPIIAAQEIEGTTVLVPETASQVLAQIQAIGISVLVLDPFISTHRVSENSNSAIELVMALWRDIAQKADIAIEIIHHFRKGNGSSEPSADDVRGASAMIGAARTVRVFACMSKEEAEEAQIDPKERRRYIWEMNAKANMHPASDDKLWRHLTGVNLDNAEGPHDADEVGVAEHWDYPTLMSFSTPVMERNALRAIAMEGDWRKRRTSVQSTGWVGYLLANLFAWDGSDPAVKKNMKALIDQMKTKKLLRETSEHDHNLGRKVPVYEAVLEAPHHDRR
jgi:hypothetical protein